MTLPAGLPSPASCTAAAAPARGQARSAAGVIEPDSVRSLTSMKARVMTLAVNDFRAWQASALRAAALTRLPAGPRQRLPSPAGRMSVPRGLGTFLTAAG